jgi:hexosaminidase
MKRGLLSLTCLLFFQYAFSQTPKLNLVPWPAEVKQGEGLYRVKNTVRLYCDFPGQSADPVINYLRGEFKKMGIRMTDTKDQFNYDIGILMRRMPTGGKPAYRLTVDSKKIDIESNFEAPAFHGVQTLVQLFPSTTGFSAGFDLPEVNIFDHARFEYRGMHLDVSRHFSPVEYIKKYIDFLARHKLNVFHWHLTDDQGWRVEIKRYPKLTEIGARRNGTIIGRYPGTGSDNQPYGGFYTQDEIREVVKYAASRYIDVIPELEMPGHSSAAIAAYPFLSCFPEKPTLIPANMISAKSVEEQKNGRIKLVQETWGIFEDVFCAGNDSTFIFLQNVLDEMVPLFPSKYFHVGGDECPKTHWKQCPKCQERIKSLGLKDEHELQSYFVQRIEKYLNAKGKTIIGWDEILEGGLAPNAVVHSWRGENGAVDAARQKHYTILSPQNPLYFDHTQSENEDSVTIGGYTPIEKLYAYDPIPKELTEEEAKYVMGAQANLWREYINNEKKTEYMLFPRMAALSEVLWTLKEKKDWNRFASVLPAQMARYRSWNVSFSNEFFALKGKVKPSPNKEGVLWEVYSRDTAPIYINFNNIDSIWPYKAPQVIDRDLTAYASIDNGDRIVQKFNISKVTGKTITLKEEASPSYPADGAFTLINGVINEKGFSRAREFLGWSGKDCEAIIDLGEITEISFVVVNSLKRHSSWIWEPGSAEVFASSDGEKWYSLKSTTEHQEKENQKITLTMAFRKTPVQFLKILVKNYGKIPGGNPGAGRDAWLFIDEIEVD